MSIPEMTHEELLELGRQIKDAEAKEARNYPAGRCPDCGKALYHYQKRTEVIRGSVVYQVYSQTIHSACPTPGCNPEVQSLYTKS